MKRKNLMNISKKNIILNIVIIMSKNLIIMISNNMKINNYLWIKIFIKTLMKLPHKLLNWLSNKYNYHQAKNK